MAFHPAYSPSPMLLVCTATTTKLTYSAQQASLEKDYFHWLDKIKFLILQTYITSTSMFNKG